MNIRYMKVCTAVVLALGLEAGASAAESDSPWSASLIGGYSFGGKGSLAPSGTTSIPDLGVLSPGLAGDAGTVTLDRLRYRDLFKRNYDIGAELDYAVGDRVQTYGRLGYTRIRGRTRDYGAVTSASLSAPLPLASDFASSSAASYELGARYLWSADTDWKPFTGLALGATHLNSLRADVSSADQALDLQDVRFTRADTVFSQRVETGVEYSPSGPVGVRFGVEAWHLGAQNGANDSALSSHNLATAGGPQARWSFPVSLAMTYRFQ